MLRVIIRSVPILTLENGLSSREIIRNKSSSHNKSISAAVRQYFMPRDVTPPYHHICQIGDPALRLQTEPVDPSLILTAEFKKFVDHLVSVMRKYDTQGLSASQIGVPVQVFAIETTPTHYYENLAVKRSGQQLKIIPLSIFINPKMKILDYKTDAYPECCTSIFGFSAHVPRARSIRIEALDLSGNKFVWNAEGWPARIAQHEMDHLQGNFFTDKMDSKTLSCEVWNEVNIKRGKISLYFFPIKKDRWWRIFA